MKLCWVNLVTLSIVSTKWLRDHLLLCVVNRFCNFSNVVAPGHQKLYWSPFTNSLSVSLQMLWPSATMNCGFLRLLISVYGRTFVNLIVLPCLKTFQCLIWAASVAIVHSCCSGMWLRSIKIIVVPSLKSYILYIVYNSRITRLQ